MQVTGEMIALVRAAGQIENRIAAAVAAERERCAKAADAEMERWNTGGEHYANVTEAVTSIVACIRSGQ